jgi:AraC-like DNA-binding protein
MMPEMDGIELCRQLKSDMRTSHIPLIFLTAKVGAESRMEGMRGGAFGFLEKPFIQEELRLSVENALLFRQRIKEHLSHAFAGGKSPDPVSMQESEVLSGERVFLDKLKSVIEAGIADEDFDITRLCRAMGMSRAQLYRKVSSLTGVSVAIYIRNIRLEKARDLLLRTEQNVSQIAYAVGFSDPNYFSKVYHERYGQSPSETRK